MKAWRSSYARSLQHSQIWTSCSWSRTWKLTCFSPGLAFSSFPGSHQSRVCDPSTCCYCCWAPWPAKLEKHWTWFWMSTDRSWPQGPQGPPGTEENNSQMKVLSHKLKVGDYSDRWDRMNVCLRAGSEATGTSPATEGREGGMEMLNHSGHIVPDSLCHSLTFKLKLTFPVLDSCSRTGNENQLFIRWQICSVTAVTKTCQL